MSEELLSAMMDGECKLSEVEALLAAVDDSPALAAQWSRMSMIRQALAGGEVRSDAFDFASSVMAAIDLDDAQIESENPKVVPLRRVAAVVAPVAVPIPAARKARGWQPMVGLAAAASITALVVAGGGSLISRPIGNVNAGQLASSDRSLALKLPASVQAELTADESAHLGAEPTETRWAQLDPSAARQLNDYLMEHSNARTESGMGGSLSYARLAVRTADYRTASEPR